MSARIAVYVHGDDPISKAGVAAQLRGRPETYVVEVEAIDEAAVAVVVTDEIDEGHRADRPRHPTRRLPGWCWSPRSSTTTL